MTDLAIIPVAGSLSDYSDPAAFVELALTRAKEWLTEAIDHGDIAGIVELKSQAEAIRVYSAQKQLGKEAEMNAAEIVRRATTGLELALQHGQRAGIVRSVGSIAADTQQLISPKSFYNDSHERADARVMASVPTEEFEEALRLARDEGNLSRANVVRKIKGDTSDERIGIARQMAAAGNSTRQIAARLGYSLGGMTNFLTRHAIDVPADVVMGRSRNLNSTRIVEGAIGSVNGIGMLFDQITYADLPAENVQGWLSILNESIRSLTTLRNRLKEMSQP